jgi:hypothetical protein
MTKTMNKMENWVITILVRFCCLVGMVFREFYSWVIICSFWKITSNFYLYIGENKVGSNCYTFCRSLLFFSSMNPMNEMYELNLLMIVGDVVLG